MIFIRHRINTSQELRAVPEENGIEIDLRTHQNRLVLAHNPFVTGELFESWLQGYRHKLLVINVKEDGLENSIEEAISEAGLGIEYLFLDQSFPTIVNRLRGGFTDSMVRVSDYESAQTLELLFVAPRWLWVDTFSEAGITTIDFGLLRGKFKMMVVSPELQGRDPRKEVASTIEFFRNLGFRPDAVCTKNPGLWKALMGENTADRNQARLYLGPPLAP